jgi:hypothetical protein
MRLCRVPSESCILRNDDEGPEFQGSRESRRQGRKRMQCVLAGRFLGDGREGQHFRGEHSGAYQRHAERRCVFRGKALARNGAISVSAQVTVDGPRCVAAGVADGDDMASSQN